MIDVAQREIERLAGVSAWSLRRECVTSLERFYTGARSRMARSADTTLLKASLFVDSGAGDGRQRSSASCILHPSLGPAELRETLERCMAAASRAPSPWYPLPGPAPDGGGAWKGGPLLEADPSRAMAEAAEALLSAQAGEDPRLNSMELFLSRRSVEIRNSEGVRAAWQNAGLDVEYVAEAGRNGDSVEIFGMASFASVEAAALRDEASLALSLARDRLAALPLKGAEGLPVLLTGSDAVQAWFDYFLWVTEAMAVYQKRSEAAPGYRFDCGPDGDPLNIAFDPDRPGRPWARPFDDAGTRLRPLQVISSGEVRALHGGLRGCHYLGLAEAGSYAAGRLASMRHAMAEVDPGSLDEGAADLPDCLEIAVFSDFQVDNDTGDFGGEIRLAYLRRGGERVPLTGGSLSGSMRECLPGMRLSRHMTAAGLMRVPRAVLIRGARVSPA